MTHGAIAGILLTDLILGRKNIWAELYHPSPAKIGGVGDFVSENLNVAPQYLQQVTPGDVDSVEKVTPGTVRRGLTKVAAYRDENGNLYSPQLYRRLEFLRKDLGLPVSRFAV
ncbi:MAG: hypothetical protein V7K27_34885 [Nostoc sp.]|uniref:hypothetical protein n=1 Tax=Nostoc sp. TaxID=1180 RepID=UPI002FF8C026